MLGAEVCAAIVAAAPVIVRVTVPKELHRVLLWPLELAQVGGMPLVDRGDVGFAYDVDDTDVAAPRERVQITERTDGVRLGELLVSLKPDKRTLEASLDDLLYMRPGAAALLVRAADALARWLDEA